MINSPEERRVWQRYLAEFIGTFGLVFVGCGAIIANHYSSGSVTHVGISIAFGAAVGSLIFALGPVSAAHFNPAVTLGFAIAGRFSWRYLAPYWLMQFSGAGLASFLHLILLPEDTTLAVLLGATTSKFPAMTAVTLEALFTFLLMLVIMAVATDRRVLGVIPALAIGGAVAMGALAGGPFTGASMNPARSFGPAILSGGPASSQLWIYVLGPMLGASIAALVYELLRDSEKEACSAPSIQKMECLEQVGIQASQKPLHR
jgi:MIP family channel proteins